ncbi:MAG: hypothetical protein HC788_04025 [Sphingopyxis sp.]|nr:hypothetical protein [Sphingopyxis sp.]
MTTKLPLEPHVLAEVEVDHGVIKAYRLAANLSQRLGRRIAANSVYRVLENLRDRGIVRRLVSQNGFVTARCATGIILVCLKCKLVDHLQADELREAVKKMTRQKCFRQHVVRLEVLGICTACAPRNG